MSCGGQKRFSAAACPCSLVRGQVSDLVTRGASRRIHMHAFRISTSSMSAAPGIWSPVIATTHSPGRWWIFSPAYAEDELIDMRAKRVTANLRVADVDARRASTPTTSRLSTEEFNMGWVARYTSPDSGAHVQLVSRDAKAPEDPVISVHTDDVDAAYEEAAEAPDTRSCTRTTMERGVCAGSSSARPMAMSSTSCAIGTRADHRCEKDSSR